MIAIGEANEQRFEHPRRGRQSVQQQQGRRVLWSGLAVKDREAIDRRRAITGRVLHGTLSFSLMGAI
jgi:plasmid stabilization system protein ParE